MTDRSLGRRRLLALLATGATSVLAGCNRLFTEPEGTPASTPTVPATPPVTSTPTPTATATSTAAPETAASGDVPVNIAGYEISFEEVPGDFVAADVFVGLSNDGERDIGAVELRVAMVYDPDGENRTVVVDYVGTAFVDVSNRNPGDLAVTPIGGGGGGGGGSGSESGDGTLVANEAEVFSYRTRFPNDGRADGSTDPDDFALRFRVTGIEYV